MKKGNYFFRKVWVLAGMIILPLSTYAEGTNPGNARSVFSNPLFLTLLAIIIALAIMVVALSGALKNLISSDLYLEKLKSAKKEKTSGGTKITSLLILFLALNLSARAQAIVLGADTRIGGLEPFVVYFLVGLIVIELLALSILFRTFKNIFRENKIIAEAVPVTKPKGKTFLDKLNDTVEIEAEESILLDHDYDGIKELDNNLPPWWKYGFYLTIFISVVYLINYHITKTAPLQAEEYTLSIKKAESEIAEYMKTSANNVDESTVKMLADPADLAAGKELFIVTCAACHGKLGEGTVGPNLTDDYWVHGGGVKDIFKTIKYGWPDKGMKSWKEDFSPIQIAQLTSFIRTLKGTNPPKAKEKQGDLYIEHSVPADSTSTKTDSLKVATADLPKEQQ